MEDPREDAERDDAAGGRVSVHRPVLTRQVIEALDLHSGLVVVDGTVGGGGHAGIVLPLLGSGGLLIGLDRDAVVLDHARRRLAQVASAGPGVGRFVLRHASFTAMQEALSTEGLDCCDRVLLDLGVSSFQLDTAERGFSFQSDGPIDMRMDRSQGTPAAAFLARAGEKEIADVLWQLGEERYARRIARAVVTERRRRAITRTRDLADLVARAVPRRERRIHPATRTFQALRMHVNDEQGQLARGLEAARTCLRPGGRLVVISFHSLEDRAVKRFMRERMTAPVRKPQTADADEVRDNPRARSARLRWCLRPDREGTA